MERETVIKKKVGEQELAYFFDIEFNQGSFLFYPYTRGYYLKACPCEVVKEEENQGRGLIRDTKNEVRELLFEINEPSEEKLTVAKEVADCYIDSLIAQIEQNKRDKKKEEEETRKEILKRIEESNNRQTTNSKNNLNNNLKGDGSMKKENDETMVEGIKPEVTLDDIAGLDEVKVELKELISGFNDKAKFEKFNIKPPRGVLLHGEPGNGKSMLAKAIAGETNGTYYEMAGSSFVEKYVGVGAKRVRELFEKARNNRPCVIFIDEIDAIGAKRETENSKEQNATLNQLLVEISSLDNEDILIIGATNREDILDPALKRQGRLSRNIFVPNPDFKTRLAILNLYAKDRPLAEDVDLELVAKQTNGMSGADMEAIIIEGCMLAIREDVEEVAQSMLLKAIDRQIAGLERKSTVMIEKEKEIVSVHEAGHLVAGIKLNSRKPSKITIVPHGTALGYVLYHEEEDRFISTREELMDRIKVSLAGAVAEKEFFGHESSGCSGDLGNVSNIARRMVCDYGMSCLGKMFIDERNAFMQEKIHEEMKKIVDEAYDETTKLIKSCKDEIKFIADELAIKETLEDREIEQLLASAEMLK